MSSTVILPDDVLQQFTPDPIQSEEEPPVDMNDDMIATLESYLNVLEFSCNSIRNQGVVRRSDAVALESISEGIVTKRTAINSYTTDYSKTNYAETLRGIQVGMESAVVAIGAAIIAVLIAITAWIVKVLTGRKGDKATAKTVTVATAECQRAETETAQVAEHTVQEANKADPADVKAVVVSIVESVKSNKTDSKDNKQTGGGIPLVLTPKAAAALTETSTVADVVKAVKRSQEEMWHTFMERHYTRELQQILNGSNDPHIQAINDSIESITQGAYLLLKDIKDMKSGEFKDLAKPLDEHVDYNKVTVRFKGIANLTAGPEGIVRAYTGWWNGLKSGNPDKIPTRDDFFKLVNSSVMVFYKHDIAKLTEEMEKLNSAIKELDTHSKSMGPQAPEYRQGLQNAKQILRLYAFIIHQYLTITSKYNSFVRASIRLIKQQTAAEVNMLNRFTTKFGSDQSKDKLKTISGNLKNISLESLKVDAEYAMKHKTV